MGGGRNIRPGEITLSHRGVLFLDELPEFSHTSLESLRQPLEDMVVTISRVSGTVTYPASFILVSAMNPCPWSFYTVQQYPWKDKLPRVGGKNLDRWSPAPALFCLLKCR